MILKTLAHELSEVNPYDANSSKVQKYPKTAKATRSGRVGIENTMIKEIRGSTI
jgi:hypothetical protein